MDRRKRTYLLEDDDDGDLEKPQTLVPETDTEEKAPARKDTAKTKKKRRVKRKAEADATETVKQEDSESYTPLPRSSLSSSSSSSLCADPSWPPRSKNGHSLRSRRKPRAHIVDPCNMTTWHLADFEKHCAANGLDSFSGELKHVRRAIKNRESASASRRRKQEQLDTLRTRVEEISASRDHYRDLFLEANKELERLKAEKRLALSSLGNSEIEEEDKEEKDSADASGGDRSQDNGESLCSATPPGDQPPSDDQADLGFFLPYHQEGLMTQFGMIEVS